MNTTRPITKSPRAVALEALRVGQQALPAYHSRFSRKDFTQPQLFAALALKAFLNTDYRGVSQLLDDWADLRMALGMTKAPHPATLCWAAGRLLKEGGSATSWPPPGGGRRNSA